MAKNMQKSLRFLRWLLVLYISIYIVLPHVDVYAQIDSSSIHRADLQGFSARIAPGEELPFIVKLINFGVAERSEINIFYKIYDDNNTVVLSQNETVAVETTASFIRRPRLSSTIPAGDYTMTAYVVYPNQTAPAISEFKFTVEKKYFGIFKSDFWWYVLILLASCSASVIVSHFVLEYIYKRSSRV